MKGHLILIGLPGSGKTTVGRLAAERLGLPFADCDAVIEAETGMTIPEIFTEKGEPWFRDAESRILAALCASRTCVIATGGGAVVAEDNRKVMRNSGVVVLIERNIDEISACVGMDERPLLQRYTLSELERQRRPWYRACAHAVVRGGTAEELAEKAAGIWRNT